MRTCLKEINPSESVRKLCFGLIFLASIIIIMVSVQITDNLPNPIKEKQSLREIGYTPAQKIQRFATQRVNSNVPRVYTTLTTTSSVKPSLTTASVSLTVRTSTSTTQTIKPSSVAFTSVSRHPSTDEIKTYPNNSTPQNHIRINDTAPKAVNNSSKPNTTNKVIAKTSVNGVDNKAEMSVRKRFPNDFFNGLHLEPFCAMQSNAHKYLIWPDTPTDLTDWTYKRIRKCPKFVIPENITFTKRVKYSLNCDNEKPKLLPSFTDRSDDIDVVSLNNLCLARFTNSCCNDTRGTPNIVHYVWYFNNEMRFSMFLSMLSIVRYVRPCLILFHGEYLPYGQYWDYIIRIYPNILHVKRSRPLFIFERKISHHEHSGDIMRMEALMQLGGIYFDTDVIVLRDLEPLRDYEMTLCRQGSYFLLNAFIMAKKNATFLTLWMDGYRDDYQNDSYTYNSMEYNDELAHNRSDLIHVEEGTLCAPDVLIGKPFNSTMVYDWSSLYGFHLYARIIRFPWDVDWIKSFNTTMGSMVRQVVYGNKELCV